MKRLSAFIVFIAVLAPAAALAAYGDAARYRSMGYATGYLGVMAMFMLFIATVVIGLFVLWILMLVDCVKREWPEKTAWTAILVLSIFMGLHWLSAILYYFLVKQKDLGVLPKVPSKRSKRPPPAG